MSRLTRDGTAEPVSRDQILRHARGQGNIHFPCSADHEQDWQPYPVDPYSAMCDNHTYILYRSKKRHRPMMMSKRLIKPLYPISSEKKRSTAIVVAYPPRVPTAAALSATTQKNHGHQIFFFEFHVCLSRTRHHQAEIRENEIMGTNYFLLKVHDV